MSSEQVLSTRDFSNETSTTTYEGVDLTAGNFAAQAALMDTLAAAQQVIQVGHVYQDARKASVETIAGVVASPYAQREMKWLVQMTASDGKKHTLEVPAPALSFLVTGSDLIDMADADVLAYIAALEAYVRIDGTLTVNVDSIRLVGRNL